MTIVVLILCVAFPFVQAADIELELNSDDNILRHYFQGISDDVGKGILIRAIVQSPQTAGRLSCVSKSWNAYVNDGKLTKLLMTSYFFSNFGDLNTYYRMKFFPTEREIVFRKGETEKQKDIKRDILQGVVVTSAFTIGLGGVAAYISSLMGYDLGLIAIPISVFVSTTGCSVFYAYTAIPKSNFNESLV